MRMTVRFARRAATTNKLRRYFLCSAVSCLLVGVFLVQDTATSRVVRGQSSRVQKRAVLRSPQLTATVISQEYCRNSVTQESQLYLKLKLSLKNTSDATLIIHRFTTGIHRLVLSKSLKKAKSGDYAYQQHATIGYFPLSSQVNTQQLSPVVEFFTLKPGESFDYEYPQSADITLTNADDPSHNLSTGRYLMQIQMKTWPWNEKILNELGQRWAQIGVLWSRDIASEPFAISIEKPSLTAPVCKVPGVPEQTPQDH